MALTFSCYINSSPNTLIASSASASDLTISQLFDPFTRYPNFSPSLLNCLHQSCYWAILPPPAESYASHNCITIGQCVLRFSIIIDVSTEYHGIARGSPGDRQGIARGLPGDRQGIARGSPGNRQGIPLRSAF